MPDSGFELDPALRDAAGIGGLAEVICHRETGRLHSFQVRVEQIQNASGPSTVTMFQVNAIRSRQ